MTFFTGAKRWCAIRNKFDVHSAMHHIISRVKPTRRTDVSNLFHFGMTLYMFRTVPPPSSGVQDCTYSNRHMSNRYCCLHPSSGVQDCTYSNQTDNGVCLLANRYCCPHPSSGVQDCTYSNRHLSNRYCCLHPSSGVQNCTYSNRHLSNR